MSLYEPEYLPRPFSNTAPGISEASHLPVEDRRKWAGTCSVHPFDNTLTKEQVILDPATVREIPIGTSSLEERVA